VGRAVALADAEELLGRLVLLDVEAISLLGTARGSAVRLLADEVPGPGHRGAVEPVPALRSELISLHVMGLPNAERVFCVTADGTSGTGRTAGKARACRPESTHKVSRSADPTAYEP
jgi:hypothetical protein